MKQLKKQSPQFRSPLVFSLFGLVLLFASSCGSSTEADNSTEFQMADKQDSISYVLGLEEGKKYLRKQFAVDPEAFKKGLYDGLYGKELMIDEEVVAQILSKVQRELQSKSWTVNLEKGREFLRSNGKRDGVVTAPSGLQYEVLKPGFGLPPIKTQKVAVNWTLDLLNEDGIPVAFDSSNADTMQVSQMIPAWNEAIVAMKPGSVWKLFVPPQLGYGDLPAEGVPPNSLMIFRLELLSVH